LTNRRPPGQHRSSERERRGALQGRREAAEGEVDNPGEVGAGGAGPGLDGEAGQQCHDVAGQVGGVDTGAEVALVGRALEAVAQGLFAPPAFAGEQRADVGAVRPGGEATLDGEAAGRAGLVIASTLRRRKCSTTSRAVGSSSAAPTYAMSASV